MLIASVMLDSVAAVIRNGKAPKNHIFLVEDIVIINITSVSNTVWLIDQNVEDDGQVSFTGAGFDAIYGVRCIEQISHVMHFTTPMRMKYYSIMVDSGSNVVCLVNMYGRIVRAGRMELILEWFRKGR